jgi:hypothetical protein
MLDTNWRLNAQTMRTVLQPWLRPNILYTATSAQRDCAQDIRVRAIQLHLLHYLVGPDSLGRCFTRQDRLLQLVGQRAPQQANVAPTLSDIPLHRYTRGKRKQ